MPNVAAVGYLGNRILLLRKKPVYSCWSIYEQIAEIMEEMELPFAYHHFAEGESPAPPFLLFLSPGENTFSADNQMYFSFKKLDIELYTDVKNPELEIQIEQVLKRHKIYYTKSEVWIESERLYEVLYETEV